ncbi:MAG: hypothetical protein ACYDAD_13705 [Acidimicrobiales bacterium]
MTVFVVLLGWILLSVPTALVLGALLGRHPRLQPALVPERARLRLVRPVVDR